MTKDKIVVEDIGDDKVAVYEYDTYHKMVSDSAMQICNRDTVNVEYDIIGEIINGDITYFNGENDNDDDYSEFSVADEEEA